MCLHVLYVFVAVVVVLVIVAFIWNPQAAIKQFLQAVFAPVHTHHAFICLKTYTFLCVLPEFPHKTIENGTFIDNKRKFSVENASVSDSELLKTEVYRFGVDGKNATSR